LYYEKINLIIILWIYINIYTIKKHIIEINIIINIIYLNKIIQIFVLFYNTPKIVY